MIHPSTRAERLLLASCAVLCAVAVAAPALVQSAHYHAFADARAWLGLPNAANVLSNLPFLLFGAWGLARLRRAGAWVGKVERAGAAVFFAGLLLTAAGSSIYHWHPGDASLALDRSAMVVAFAGLLALATADKISPRAGAALGVALPIAAAAGIWIWFSTGNLLPWALVQGGGMALLLVLAPRRSAAGALAVRWGWVIVAYAIAKAFELADETVFDATGALLSGHSAKHLVAAFSALPVISALRRRPRPIHNPSASAGALDNTGTIA